MSSLRRTMAAGFTLEQAVTLEQLQQSDNPAGVLLGVDHLFAHLPILTLSGKAETMLRNGMRLPMPRLSPGEYRVYGEDSSFLALCRAQDGLLITTKSFFAV